MVRLRQFPILAGLGGLAVWCLAAWPASAESVYTLRLPAPVSELAEVADVGGSRPTARIVDDVIRAIHPLAPGISANLDARRARVLAWLESPPSSTALERSVPVPSPLPSDCWRAALGATGATEEQITVRLLTSREFSLVYYALMRATPGLRRYLAPRPELVAALAQHHAGVLAAFPRAVDVVDGRVRPPGDPSLVAFWESLVGASTTDASAFLMAVQARADGRIAFMLDTLARLDEARRLFALSAGAPLLPVRLDDLGVLADAFVNTHREWRPAERPFWRTRMDPLVVLAGIDVDADGRLAGPQGREFWRRVIDGQPPAAGSTELSDDPGVVTAGWLVSRVISREDLASQLRLGAVAFTQRLLRKQAGRAPVEVAAAGAMFVDLPALMLVLERIGIVNPQSYVAAATAALALTEGAGAPDGEWALTTFQASVAIIDRAVARRRLGFPEASALLDDLCAIRDLGESAGRRALSRWVGSRLVPALANGGDRVRDAETMVLDALSGVGGDHPDGPSPNFELDGEPYRLDLARSERERLDAIRRRQRSVRLTAALRLVDDADALLAARSTEDFDRAGRGAFETLGHAMSPRGTRSSAEANEDRLLQARALLGGPGTEPTGVRGGDRRRVLREVVAAADWAVADALRGIVYSVSLGDADGVVTLAPDVSRRHSLGAGRVPGPALTAWSLPEQLRDDAQVWFVRGALLGLEGAMPALALRHVLATADAPAPFIYEIARRQLALTVALGNPFDVTNGQRDRLVGAVRRGEGEVATLCDAGRPPIDEGADGLVGYHVQWACAHDPLSLPGLMTLDRLVALGGLHGPTADLDALGTARAPLSSPLSVRWPDQSGLLGGSGRIVDGLFVSTVVAPAVRVAQVLAARGLPAALAPAVLALFVADLVREAPVSFEADAFGLALGAIEVSEDRFDNYLASLAAGGPIVPASPAGSARP